MPSPGLSEVSDKRQGLPCAHCRKRETSLPWFLPGLFLWAWPSLLFASSFFLTIDILSVSLGKLLPFSESGLHHL